MKYTALTIGPIIKSLGFARKTREIWAASYFFSHFMETVIEILKEAVPDFEQKIVIPFANKTGLVTTHNLKEDSNQTGLFPDRLIVESETGLLTEMQDAVHATIEKLSNEFSIENTYLKQYITCPCIELDSCKNAIFECNAALAVKELQQAYIPKDKELFTAFLEKVHSNNKYKYLFKNGFPSIIEIATSGLNIPSSKFNSDDDDDKSWENVKEHINEENKQLRDKDKIQLKQAHKYVAIVQADGDNVGKLIKAIYDKDSSLIPEFSKALSAFALIAASKIRSWGGVPVYAGGDDLLFFAPINNGTESIINLIGSIDEIFREMIIVNPTLSAIIENLAEQPSMSYGLSISYYKYPMHEALRSAQSLLFGEAKQTKKKNAIAFSLLKHSGQTYSAILHKDNFSNSAYAYLSKIINGSGGLEMNSFLHHINRDDFILKAIIHSESKLKNYFKNYYNEDMHKTPKAIAFMELLAEMLYNVYRNNEINYETTMRKVKASLQFVKFLNAKNDE